MRRLSLYRTRQLTPQVKGGNITLNKILCFLICSALYLTSGYKVYAQSNAIDCNGSYLRIFTTYDTLKSVFISTDEDIYSEYTNIEYKNNSSKNIEDKITGEDVDLIAAIVHGESRGEPFEGKVGVASVVFNRLMNPDFPKTIKDVIFEKNAFSCVENGYISIKPDVEAYRAVNEAIKGNDPTENAVYFYNPKTASSNWIRAVPKKSTIKIGSHIFFR